MEACSTYRGLYHVLIDVVRANPSVQNRFQGLDPSGVIDLSSLFPDVLFSQTANIGMEGSLYVLVGDFPLSFDTTKER